MGFICYKKLINWGTINWLHNSYNTIWLVIEHDTWLYLWSIYVVQKSICKGTRTLLTGRRPCRSRQTLPLGCLWRNWALLAVVVVDISMCYLVGWLCRCGWSSCEGALTWQILCRGSGSDRWVGGVVRVWEWGAQPLGSFDGGWFTFGVTKVLQNT